MWNPWVKKQRKKKKPTKNITAILVWPFLFISLFCCNSLNWFSPYLTIFLFFRYWSWKKTVANITCCIIIDWYAVSRIEWNSFSHHTAALLYGIVVVVIALVLNLYRMSMECQSFICVFLSFFLFLRGENQKFARLNPRTAQSKMKWTRTAERKKQI